MSQLLDGKTGLVMGVANKRSIAWAIANAANRAGARLILTYQNERFGENVRDLAPQLNNPLVLPCDVASVVAGEVGPTNERSTPTHPNRHSPQ